MTTRDYKRALAAAVSLLAIALPTSQAAAMSDREEIRALLARVKKLEAKAAKTEGEVKHATNIANAAHAKAGHPIPPPVFVSFKNGLYVETEDGKTSFKIGGRIFIDGGGMTNPLTGKSGNAGIRRARLEVEGKYKQYWFYKLQYDFAGSNTLGAIVTGAPAVGAAPYGTSPIGGMRDAYIGFQHPILSVPFAKDPLWVMVGNHYEPSSLELLTSSKYIDFIERSLPTDAFGANRHIGASIGARGDDWSVKGGVYTTSPEDKAQAPWFGYSTNPWIVAIPATAALGKTQASTGGGQYFDIAARGTWAPIKDEHRLLHIGGWGRYHRPNDSTAANDDRVLALGSNLRSEANILGQNLVGTPDLSCGSVQLYNFGAPPAAPATSVAGKCVKDVMVYGGEVVGSYGPVSVQAEYMGARYNRNANHLALASVFTAPSATGSVIIPGSSTSALGFDGYYVYGTWYLTGEERAEAYNVKDRNGAAFEQIKIKNPLSAGGWGAWELGLRFSSVNLNSGPITGSTYHNLVQLATLTAGNNPLNNVFVARGVVNASVNGGRQQDVTVGLNWYPDKGIRVMANYTRVVTEVAPWDKTYLNGQHPNIFLVRTQVDW